MSSILKLQSHMQIIECVPGGNPTALVAFTEDFLNPIEFSSFAKKLMKRFPHIEQVGFILPGKNGGDYHLEMAGGEFCVNALLSLVAVISGFPDYICDFAISNQSTAKTRTFQLTCSGFAGTVTGTAVLDDPSVCVCSFSTEQVHMVAKSDLGLEGFSGCIGACSMSGIAHVLINGDQFNYRPLRTTVEKIISSLRSTRVQMQPAIGVNFFYAKGNTYFLDPWIYIPSLGSLVNETACGSASASLHMALNEVQFRDSRLIKQPSGSSLTIRSWIGEPRISVSGPVQVRQLDYS